MKRVQFSKLIVFVSWIIFIACLIVDFTAVFNNMYETATLITATSVVGAVCGSTTVWYSKKSATENQVKLRMGLYKKSIDERLRFNEEMLKLQQKYNVGYGEIQNIDMMGEADEFMNDALNSAVEALDMARNEADSPNEIQSFNL